MNSDVDKFIRESKQWGDEIAKLRSVIQKTSLEENFKWRLPCYTHEEKNIVIIQPFKNCLALMFFKGTLLKDKEGILVDVGPNSQSARRIEFTSVKEITQLASSIKGYIKEAIEIEDSGKKVKIEQNPPKIPDELKSVFNKNAKFKKAFESLTPGRQRAYVLNISAAKQSSTRLSRIEKFMPRILEGKGLNDR